MYVCILHLLRTNMSCKWDGKSFICTNRRCMGIPRQSQFDMCNYLPVLHGVTNADYRKILNKISEKKQKTLT